MQDYPHFHKNRTNLLLHIVVVPLFVLGVVYAIVAAFQGRWLAALLSLALPLVSIAVQGVGHKKEVNPPLPFDGPGEFLTRIFSEQFYKFPKFVLSGQWLRALRSSD
ncbi:MAG: Mpo1-like protein [Polyangiales bacterium]